MPAQPAKAEMFRALHRASEILVLPNVWDCASARIVEEAGFPAIATTSAGVANALGYPDGERIPAVEMLAAVERIARCVRVPVTADLERGYHDVAATAAGLVASGAVGLNLEDAGGDTVQHAARIATVRRVGCELGVNLVINARTDLYLDRIGCDPALRFDQACERLRAYIGAGADCVFVPGVTDEDTIARFVQALRFPLNVLATAGTPPIRRLRELGVARVSVGSAFARAAMGHRAGTEDRRLLRYDVASRHSILPQPPLRKIAGGGTRQCVGNFGTACRSTVRECLSLTSGYGRSSRSRFCSTATISGVCARLASASRISPSMRFAVWLPAHSDPEEGRIACPDLSSVRGRLAAVHSLRALRLGER